MEQGCPTIPWTVEASEASQEVRKWKGPCFSRKDEIILTTWWDGGLEAQEWTSFTMNEQNDTNNEWSNWIQNLTFLHTESSLKNGFCPLLWFQGPGVWTVLLGFYRHVMSNPRTKSPGKSIYHQYHGNLFTRPPVCQQILPLMKPQNLHNNCQHESLPGHSGQPSDGSGPSNLASAQISSSTRANFPDRHANDKGDNGKAWTKHWASTSQIFRWIAIFGGTFGSTTCRHLTFFALSHVHLLMYYDPLVSCQCHPMLLFPHFCLSKNAMADASPAYYPAYPSIIMEHQPVRHQQLVYGYMRGTI